MQRLVQDGSELKYFLLSVKSSPSVLEMFWPESGSMEIKLRLLLVFAYFGQSACEWRLEAESVVNSIHILTFKGVVPFRKAFWVENSNGNEFSLPNLRAERNRGSNIREHHSRLWLRALKSLALTDVHVTRWDLPTNWSLLAFISACIRLCLKTGTACDAVFDLHDPKTDTSLRINNKLIRSKLR